MKKRMAAGFTLAETLITVLLIGIVFMSITGGFVAFLNAYNKITRKANAQVMLSTTVMEVTEDLKNATTYYSNKNAFFTDSRGYSIYYAVDEKSDETKALGAQAMVYSETSTTLKNLPLLTKKANTNGLIAVISDLSYDSTKDIFTVTVKIQVNDSTNEEIEKQQIIVKPIKTVEVVNS